VRIDTATGLLAVGGRSSRMEAFVAGSEPVRKAAPPETEPGGDGVPAVAGRATPEDSVE
jgi:hypothetical protein